MDRRLTKSVRAGAGPHHEPARGVQALISGPQVDWAAAIGRLHDFFAAWFAGHVPDEPGAATAMTDALAPGFTIVSPHGDVLDRAATIAAVRDAHGIADGGPRITTGEVEVLSERPPFATVRYVEIHEWDDGRRTERWSTALLEADAGAPDGVRWHTVHETWRRGRGPSER